MTAVRSAAVSVNGTNTPTVVFGTPAVAGDVVILTQTRNTTGTSSALAGLPTGMGGTWTLIQDWGDIAFWIGRNITAGQTTVTCTPTGRFGSAHRFIGYLVSGINNNAAVSYSLNLNGSTHTALEPFDGPAMPARNGQFVAATAVLGNNLSMKSLLPDASDIGMQWVRYEPGTAPNAEYMYANPNSPRLLDHQVSVTSTQDVPSEEMMIGQVVIGDYTGPTTSRAYSTHSQVVVKDDPAQARMAQTYSEVVIKDEPARAAVHVIQVQVLLPTELTAVNVNSTFAEVLVSKGWVVSASDGRTAVQQLHSDGRWRPLYVRE